MRIAMLGLKGIPATFGGVERHVEELSASLVPMGHEVMVYCRKNYTNPQLREHRGVALKVLPSIGTKHLDAISHTALALSDAMRRTKPDIIHFHSAGPGFLSFVPRLAGKSAVVATVHAQDWRRKKWGPFSKVCLRMGEWACGRFPHRTIVVSREMADAFRRKGREVAHIPNGVEPPEHAELDELKRLGISEAGFILWMGRFVPEKRVEDIIAAFRGIPDRRLQLVLAGEQDPSDAYFQKVKAAANGDARIILPGGLYGRKKREALSNAGLVVLASELEGFPIALLEGMRYGRPVLASDIAANLEAIRPNENGFIFRTGDFASLRAGIEKILSDSQKSATVALRGEADSARFDWGAIAKETESVYEAAIDISGR